MDGCVDVGVLVILYYDLYLFEWGLAVVQWLPYNQEWILFCLRLVMENWDKLVNFSTKCYTLLFTNAYYCFSHTYASWSTYIIIELFWFKNWRVPLWFSICPNVGLIAGDNFTGHYWFGCDWMDLIHLLPQQYETLVKEQMLHELFACTCHLCQIGRHRYAGQFRCLSRCETGLIPRS